MRKNDLFKFIRERYQILLNKEVHKRPKPWTNDPILQQYRFCNVYRESDTVTKWIGINWRMSRDYDPNLWFAMAIARYINWPATLHDIGYPSRRGHWQDRILEVIAKREAAGEKVYSGAYMISTHSQKIRKANYIVEKVLTPLWEARKELERKNFNSLQEFHDKLSSFYGVGSFMSGQIIADVKYAEPYCNMPDWWTFAASGPGSRRGLNRVFNQPKDKPWKEELWKSSLYILHQSIRGDINKANMPKMHAQDLQNCLCEFDKYERVRLGEGRPRALYPGV